MKPQTRTEMMERLGFFIGTWAVEVNHPQLQPNPIVGKTKFEWMDETYIIQRTHIDKAEFPSSTIIYDWDSASGNYVQHYFDTRGVTRLYQMSFEGAFGSCGEMPLTFRHSISFSVLSEKLMKAEM